MQSPPGAFGRKYTHVAKACLCSRVFGNLRAFISDLNIIFEISSDTRAVYNFVETNPLNKFRCWVPEIS